MVYCRSREKYSEKRSLLKKGLEWNYYQENQSRKGVGQELTKIFKKEIASKQKKF